MCLISASLNKGHSSSFRPDVSKIPGNPQMDSGSVKGARGKLQAKLCRRSRGELQAGHCPKQTPKHPKRILKFGKETTSLEGVVGNCNIVIMIMSRMSEGVAVNCNRTVSMATWLKIQGVAGNCNKKLNSNYRRPGWTTITCKSQIMGTLKKSS